MICPCGADIDREPWRAHYDTQHKVIVCGDCYERDGEMSTSKAEANAKATKATRAGLRYYVGEWSVYTRESFERLVVENAVPEGSRVGIGTLKAVEFERVQHEPTAVITVPDLKREPKTDTGG